MNLRTFFQVALAGLVCACTNSRDGSATQASSIAEPSTTLRAAEQKLTPTPPLGLDEVTETAGAEAEAPLTEVVQIGQFQPSPLAPQFQAVRVTDLPNMLQGKKVMMHSRVSPQWSDKQRQISERVQLRP